AVHAERMQLHQLTGVVFVEPTTRPIHLLPKPGDALIEFGIGEVLVAFDLLAKPRRNVAAADRLCEPSVAARRLRVRCDRFEVVEVEKHRRMLCRADNEVAEIAESMLSKHVAFIARNVPADGGLARED